MIEVTESDTKAATALAHALFDGDYDPKNIKDTFTNAFATHRIEAAKAERDRIVAWLREMGSIRGGVADSIEAGEHLEEQQP